VRVVGVRILGEGDLVDVLVEDGIIRDIVPSDAVDPPRRAHVMLPGLVDLHTHLREPGQEGAETIRTGTLAAAAGGFTDVFAMPNTEPATDTPERVRALRRRTDRGAHARVHVIGAATVGRAGRSLVDVNGLLAEGVRIFSDDGACLNDARLVAQLLAATAHSGGVFAQHAQDHDIAGKGIVHDSIADQLGVEGWPAAGEEAVIARDLGILAETGGHLHVCHVSTRGAVELIRQAKRDGLNVTAEVTPHHLVLTDQDVLRRGSALKVNPPLREAQDVEATMCGLRDGTIDIVATDHAPHPSSRKEAPLSEAAFGLTGLENAIAVVADVLLREDGTTDWRALSRVLAYAPSRIGSLPDGLVSGLRIGDPATFCVVSTGPDPQDAAPTRSRSANAAFAGRRFRSRVERTVLEGRETYRAAAAPRG
jgi:dihydroorotase